MTLTPGGNPVCPTCGRWHCVCTTHEQSIVAEALMSALGNEVIARSVAADVLNALNAAGYDVVLADI